MLTSTTVGAPNLPKKSLEQLIRAVWFAAVPGLFDSLIHDARNPLNAVTLNLEVLSEKLRALPNRMPSVDKNLRAIRAQVTKLDAILRRFAEFISARPVGEGEANLSDLVGRAVEVLGPEARAARVKLLAQIEPGLKVHFQEASAAPFVALHALLRAIQRSEPGGEVRVLVGREGDGVGLSVTHSAQVRGETHADVLSALELACVQNGGSVSVRGGEWRVVLPLVHQP